MSAAGALGLDSSSRVASIQVSKMSVTQRRTKRYRRVCAARETAAGARVFASLRAHKFRSVVRLHQISGSSRRRVGGNGSSDREGREKERCDSVLRR